MAAKAEIKPLVLDVREELRQGGEPFARIMGAVNSLKPDQALELWAIFEPRPLFGVLGGMGFAYTSEPQENGDWRILFYRPDQGQTTTSPEPASESKAVWIRYQDAVAFQPGRFNPVLIGGTEQSKALLVCLEPGQFIPVHRPGVDLTLTVIEGQGTLTAGDREGPVGPGEIAFIPAGEARGLKANTRMIAVHVVSPPPTAADHSEVVAKLEAQS